MRETEYKKKYHRTAPVGPRLWQCLLLGVLSIAAIGIAGYSLLA